MKLISYNNSCLRSECAISTHQMIELGVVNKNMKEVPYRVYYNKKEVEVRCTCALLVRLSIIFFLNHQPHSL